MVAEPIHEGAPSLVHDGPWSDSVTVAVIDTSPTTRLMVTVFRGRKGEPLIELQSMVSPRGDGAYQAGKQRAVLSTHNFTEWLAALARAQMVAEEMQQQQQWERAEEPA